MMPVSKFLYLLAMKLYEAIVFLVSPLNPKAALWIEGRKKNNYTFPSAEKRIWIHAASLGEYEQVKPVYDSLKKKYPDKKFVFTFFSPSGYENAKKKQPEDEVLFLPIDTPDNAKFIVHYINPQIAIFVKYEFWYFTIRQLFENNVPVLLITAFFKKEQLFFKSYGWMFKEMLHYYRHIFVQDKNSTQLLAEIGISHVSICGDTRFDRVLKIADDITDFEIIHAYTQHSKIFIAGSTWLKDENLVVSLINNVYKAYPDYKFIIAPHEINNDEIESLQKKIIPANVRYSLLSEEDAMHYKVLIIDNIGMLSRLYRYADLVYVGGGFNNGIHNILEPAVYGVPVFFGPKHQRFKEAHDLKELKTAFTIKNEGDLISLFSNCAYDEAIQQHCKKENEIYFEENSGATEKIINYISQNI
jgi:3-deoxy-D-manno-octulosonic-acid transferase